MAAARECCCASVRSQNNNQIGAPIGCYAPRLDLSAYRPTIDPVSDLPHPYQGPDHEGPGQNENSSGFLSSSGVDWLCVDMLYQIHTCANMYTIKHNWHRQEMSSTTVSVRIDPVIKKRLEKLAKSTGRSRSFLAAEAINEYLNLNEWQVAGIQKAVASLDRGEGVAHERVKEWVNSWGRTKERSAPKRAAP